MALVFNQNSPEGATANVLEGLCFMQGYTGKLEYHLFIGKVAEIIGQEKTLELLKETKEAIKKANQNGQEKNT